MSGEFTQHIIGNARDFPNDKLRQPGLYVIGASGAGLFYWSGTEWHKNFYITAGGKLVCEPG